MILTRDSTSPLHVHRFLDLKHVKTSDFGTPLELIYIIKLKKPDNEKSFIDERRCRNGNRNISLTLKEFEN